MDSRGMVNMLSLSFSVKALFSFLMFVLTPLIQADEDDQLRSTGIFATVFWCIVSPHLRLGRIKHWNRFLAGAGNRFLAGAGNRFLAGAGARFLAGAVARFLAGAGARFLAGAGAFFLTSSDNIRIYIETANFVVISYVSLLLVNWSHIWLAVFPLIAVGFILVLCYELSRLSTSQQEHGAGQGFTIICPPSVQETGDGSDPEKDERHEAAVLVPYWVFCIMGHYSTADNFAVSQFLLFFSSMLGALTRMLMRLALTGASPGVARAAVLLRKATLLVLLATVHALAAELLGENVVLFILPELVPVLLWFSLHLDSDNSSSFIITAKDRIESCFNVSAAAAAVGALFAFVPSDTMADEVVLSWYAKAMVSCAVSGLLVYYLAFMLSQWPELESTTTAPFVEEAAKLLKHWAKCLVIAAAALLLYAVLAGVGLGLLAEMVAQPSNFSVTM